MRSNGIVLWEGMSQFDNTTPIVVIATGLVNRSSNAKTGPMVQVYIIEQNRKPTEVLSDCSDGAICGDCKHNYSSGERSCYVNVGQSVNSVWAAYQRDSYTRIDLNETWGTVTSPFWGERVRIGTYGDPAAVPFDVWEPLLDTLKKSRTEGTRSMWTAYTHGWKYTDPRFKSFCMASVDNEEEYQLAHSEGWRTFRTMAPMEEPSRSEFYCPATDDHLDRTGHQVNCIDCGQCNGGDRRASVAIYIHGPEWKKNAYLTVRGQELATI